MAGTFCERGKRCVPGQPSLALSTFPALQTVSLMDHSSHRVCVKWYWAWLSHGCWCFRPEKIEIGKVMSLQQVKQKIPTALFSWSLYTGSHEGLSTNLKACALIALQSPSSGQPIYHQSRYYQPIFAIFLCSASADTFYFFCLAVECCKQDFYFDRNGNTGSECRHTTPILQ